MGKRSLAITLPGMFHRLAAIAIRAARLRWVRRTDLVVGQLAVTIFIKRQQRLRCVGDFLLVEDMVVIFVQGLHDRIFRWPWAGLLRRCGFGRLFAFVCLGVDDAEHGQRGQDCGEDEFFHI